MSKGEKIITTLLISILVFMIILSYMLFNLFAFNGEITRSPERIRENAIALEARGLFEQALGELDRYRESGLSKEDEADLLYKMAKMADENLGDCDRALGYYTMASALNPDASWATEAGKRSVVCMEKAGKKKQAQALLVQLTGGDPSAPAPKKSEKIDSPTVAVLDGRSVTWAEVEAAMKLKMKPENISDPQMRKQMVNSYIFTWMLAEEARRAGLDSAPEIKSAIDQAGREALASSYLENKLSESRDKAAQKELFRELFKLHQARIFDEAIPAP